MYYKQFNLLGILEIRLILGSDALVTKKMRYADVKTATPVPTGVVKNLASITLVSFASLNKK